MTDLFFGYLDKNVPGYGGCALFELGNESETSFNRYMVAVRIKISNGDMFLLNGRFYHDYEHMFDKDKWKAIYKKVV